MEQHDADVEAKELMWPVARVGDHVEDRDDVALSRFGLNVMNVRASRPCASRYDVQCAAVRKTPGATSVPVQNCAYVPLVRFTRIEPTFE